VIKLLDELAFDFAKPRQWKADFDLLNPLLAIDEDMGNDRATQKWNGYVKRSSAMLPGFVFSNPRGQGPGMHAPSEGEITDGNSFAPAGRRNQQEYRHHHPSRHDQPLNFVPARQWFSVEARVMFRTRRRPLLHACDPAIPQSSTQSNRRSASTSAS
jgi:hypothetical protein